MPTPVLRPWDDEVNIPGSSNISNKKRRVTPTNAAVANVKTEVGGAIRPEERTNATMDTDTNSSKKNSLTNDIGATITEKIFRDMAVGGHVYESSGGKIADAERNRNRDGEASSKVPSKENSFFARLDELKAYKEKHGRLRVTKKVDLPVQTLSSEEQRKASTTPVLRPWDEENMTGSNNKKRRVRTIALTNETAGDDGAIRLEERINAMDAAAKHSLPESIGATEVAIVSISKPSEVDTIENDDHNVTPSFNSTQNDFQPLRQNHGGEGLQPVEQSHDELDIVQQMDNLQEKERLKPSKPKVITTPFFDRVDELKAYKDEHGHLKLNHKKDKSLYDFCYNVRQSRKRKGSYTLDDNRIAALDAIGFKWGKSSLEKFIDQVDELKAYKERHGHLNVHHLEDRSLYMFCYHVRQARRVPKCTRTKLTEDRVAALDAIGFDWKLEAGASSSVASKDDKQKYTAESSVQPPSTEAAGVSSRGRTRKMSRAMAESVSQQAFYEDAIGFN